MTGRIAVITILVAAAMMGAVVWYMQVWGYYSPIPAQTGITVTRLDGTQTPVSIAEFQGIDADSSPIRYRACFCLAASLPPGTQPFAAPEPLLAPYWFDCFDAGAIAAALADGTARAFMAQPNIRWGVDRVVAVFDDGRAVAWHQINACGREVFEGRPAPDGCPPLPELPNG